MKTVQVKPCSTKDFHKATGVTRKEIDLLQSVLTPQKSGKPWALSVVVSLLSKKLLVVPKEGSLVQITAAGRKALKLWGKTAAVARMADSLDILARLGATGGIRVGKTVFRKALTE